MEKYYAWREKKSSVTKKMSLDRDKDSEETLREKKQK